MNALNYRIEHIGLPARRPIDLRNWYIGMLEAVEIWTDDQTPPAFLMKLLSGEVLEIYPSTSSFPETGDNKLAGWRHLALRVQNIDEAKKLLETRGVRFDEAIKPAGGKGRVVFFKDLEGNLLHLVERPSDWSLTDLSFPRVGVA